MEDNICPVTDSEFCPSEAYRLECPRRREGKCPMNKPKQENLLEPISTIEREGSRTFELIKLTFPVILLVIFTLVSAYFQLNFLPRKEAEEKYVKKETYDIQLKNIEGMLSNLELTLREYNNTLKDIRVGQDVIKSEVMVIKGQLQRDDQKRQ